MSRHNEHGMGIKFAFKLMSASKIAYYIQGQNIVLFTVKITEPFWVHLISHKHPYQAWKLGWIGLRWIPMYYRFKIKSQMPLPIGEWLLSSQYAALNQGRQSQTLGVIVWCVYECGRGGGRYCCIIFRFIVFYILINFSFHFFSLWKIQHAKN